MSGFARRLAALTRKETRQMLRDRSNLAVGLLLPAVLILLFGYGLTFDVRDARIAVVVEDGGPAARELVASVRGSPYLAPSFPGSMAQAERAMREDRADAILRIPDDFTARGMAGEVRVQLILRGTESTLAMSMENFVHGAVAAAFARQADRQAGRQAAGGAATVIQRNWFNEAGESRWFLVPGLVVVVLTLLGALLTSLLVAREWERGTVESLFVTPVRPLEIVLAKIAPYLAVGAVDLAICLAAARFLFDVPIRGSPGIIAAVSMLYLLVALALGLFISALTRNQFAASQMALLASFLPAIMLSGFVFDLRNVPELIRWIGTALPATHFIALVKTLFLGGDDRAATLRVSAILAAYAAVLLALARHRLRKRLD